MKCIDSFLTELDNKQIARIRETVETIRENHNNEINESIEQLLTSLSEFLKQVADQPDISTVIDTAKRVQSDTSNLKKGMKDQCCLRKQLIDFVRKQNAKNVLQKKACLDKLILESQLEKYLYNTSSTNFEKLVKFSHLNRLCLSFQKNKCFSKQKKPSRKTKRKTSQKPKLYPHTCSAFWSMIYSFQN